MLKANLKVKVVVISLHVLLGVLLLPWQAAAGYFEYSIGFNFDRSEYGDGSFSWSRRWGTSLGYNFSDISQIEVSFQDVVNRNRYAGFEDSNYHDRIYSLNWVQSLFGKEFFFRPYVKAGVGQLNRTAVVSNYLGRRQESNVDSLTAVAGAGIKISITRAFGIRVEATSYLSGGRIKTWRDNLAGTIGGSIYF